MIVKICGMMYPDNIKAVLELNPDFLGFIFYPKSPRYIVDENPNLELIPSAIGRIGVFVNEASEIIEEMIERYHLTGVQLHGCESSEECRYFKDKGLTVFKAFGVNEDFNFSQLDAYAGAVDLFVLDTKVKSHGGSGLKFDWELLNRYNYDIPFLLSGGISVEDAKAIREIGHPAMVGVDLNSKFEIEPGLKDTKLLSCFLEQLREENK